MSRIQIMNVDLLMKDLSLKMESRELFVVAIDGRSGSGKSSLSLAIAEALSGAQIISLDVFDLYRGAESMKRVLDEVLVPLENSEQVRFEDFDGDRVVEPAGLVVIEGIFAMSKLFLPYYDYKVWVECDPDVGFERGLARDLELNGIDNSEKWRNYWMPKEEEYVVRENPRERADFVLDLG